MTYPSMFSECGLKSVEAHGILSAFLLNDCRKNEDELLKWLGDRLEVFLENQERDAYYMRHGRLGSQSIAKYQQLFEQYLRDLLQNHTHIRDTSDMRIVSRTITIGKKA